MTNFKLSKLAKIRSKILLPILLFISIIFYSIFILQDVHPVVTFVVFSIAISLSIILAFTLYSNIHSKLERIQRNINDNIRSANSDLYNQLQGYIHLHNLIQPKYSLPKMREWAASPDFLTVITDTIIEKKPSKILEVGSGTSTLIMAYILHQSEDLNGIIVSLEHDEEYAQKTADLITKHNLNKIVDIHQCPVKKYHVNKNDFLWYDLNDVTDLENIDLLVIDGPPALDWFDKEIEIYSRYGALPLLHDKLNDGTVILLDDARRKREKEIVEMWLSEFSDLKAEYIDTEKGAYLIKKG